MSDLFSIEPSLSPRLRWMQEVIGTKILTHHADNCDPPWLAVLVQNDDAGNDIGTIMAESCCYYEECGFSAEAETEMDAVVEVARKNNIRLWNEP